MENYEKYLSNEALMEALETVSAPEELKAVLAQHNVTLENDAELEQLFDAIKHSSSEELDEDSLENVSGGTVLLAPFIGVSIGMAYAVYRRTKKRKNH